MLLEVSLVPVEMIELPTFGLQNGSASHQINALGHPCCSGAARIIFPANETEYLQPPFGPQHHR
jgi:hypothetical protein